MSRTIGLTFPKGENKKPVKDGTPKGENKN